MDSSAVLSASGQDSMTIFPPPASKDSSQALHPPPSAKDPSQVRHPPPSTKDSSQVLRPPPSPKDFSQAPRPPSTKPDSSQVLPPPTSKDSAPVFPPPSPKDSIKMASVPLQPLKRTRKSNPKVKTGCSNCKQRRIKCDEARPACSQCLRTNRTCIGYPPPSRGDSVMLIAPKPLAAAQLSPISPLHQETELPLRRSLLKKRRPALPLIYEPATGPTFRHVEGLYFNLFRLHTASELSGYFSSSFWAQRVLQECHYEKAIRHAVVALGALYKTLEQSCEPRKPGHVDSAMSHWHVAVRQYSEACNAMLLIGHDENVRSNRTRLMASVLLACFDSFIGDHKQAIVQIQTGLGLLERIQTHGQSPSQHQVEQDIIVVFTRLAIQAKSYDMAFHFPQPYVIRLAPLGSHAAALPVSTPPGSKSPEISIPHRFASAVEARLASDRLCETLLRFIERLQDAKNNASNVLPSSWQQYGLKFKAQLDAWSYAFDHILESRLSPRITHLEKSGICALKMFQVNTNVLFMMMFCDTEAQFDAFEPHFRAIVSLGWEVVGADEKRATAPCLNPGACHARNATLYPNYNVSNMPNEALQCSNPNLCHAATSPRAIKPSFSADLGIVPPLFVVATKCREPRLRRQAIQLLSSSARREGMWDSQLAARIGQWIMEVEEEDEWLGPAAVPMRPIPENKRVMVKAVDFDLRAKHADVRVGTRAVYEGCVDLRSRETRLSW
ncbi:hypothetical protein CDD82_7147 [Ophiocordyceps australis]|uniref:Zn(2)-C6 fungal-type domain-containing protein n=1 Tax=Ophiocordyceps australis TaxID=1399860 RepID=A0A2C5ZPY7_9HYPO|nr:hypothetical protein CDD82_7147 [Ophiocordyceps australis]